MTCDKFIKMLFPIIPTSTRHDARCFCCFISCLWFILITGTCAAAADNETWQSLPTKYTVLHFQSQEDLEQFNKDIDYSSSIGFGALFGSSDGKDFNAKLIKKIDDLFVRAQQILDMRKYMRRVQINIYHNKEKLQEAYNHISDVKTDSGQTEHIVKPQFDFRAWYLFDQNTIYLQINDIDEGMLAHEMAHSIIDNYFQVRPPPAAAEIMARYVDAHLTDR